MAAPATIPSRTDDAWSAVCVGSRDGSHRMRVVGYLRGPRPHGLPCLQPLRVVCRHPGCAAETAIRCNGHRQSRCAPCASRYRARLSRLAQHGILAREGSGAAGMLTVTAPGVEGHSEFIPGRPGDHGPCGCWKAARDGLERWNPSAAARWNHLRTLLDREYPGMVYVRAAEVQKRGALHFHVLLWSPKPVVLQRMRELAMRAGFGCSVDWAPCDPGSRRWAYYLAKYITKSTDERDHVPWKVERLNKRTGEIRLMHSTATFRTWSSSRDWGLTMKQIREALRAAAQRQASLTPAPPAGSPAVVPAPAISGDPPPI